MIEVLVQRALKDSVQNKNIKSIVRPEKVLKVLSPHHFLYKKHALAVDTNKEKICGAMSPAILTDRLRINHYWPRDQQFFIEKKIGRRNKEDSNFEDFYEEIRHYNMVEDRIMDHFAPALRQAMFGQTLGEFPSS